MARFVGTETGIPPSRIAELRQAAEAHQDPNPAHHAWARYRDDTGALGEELFHVYVAPGVNTEGWEVVATLAQLEDPFFGAEVIHSYSRAQAIEDGVLVDVTSTAREAGITFPVAMTRSAFEDLVAWAPENGAWQDESGRLWDVVNMTRFAILRGRDTDRVRVDLLRVPNRPGARRAESAHCWAQCGPGDDAAPVITLMRDGED